MPRTTQQMMIMIFFCAGRQKETSAQRAPEEDREGGGAFGRSLGEGPPMRAGKAGGGAKAEWGGAGAGRGGGVWGGGLGRLGATDPASLALVLDGLLGVRHCPLHVVHRMFHVVLNPVNHLPLCGQGHPSSRGPPQGWEGAQGRISGKQPEVRERGDVRGGGTASHLGPSHQAPRAAPQNTTILGRELAMQSQPRAWGPCRGCSAEALTLVPDRGRWGRQWVGWSLATVTMVNPPTPSSRHPASTGFALQL